MLTHEENMLVTRTGPGTPMGEAMRRYWIPALISTELPELDGPPVRVQLLGEKLVAFRDTQGSIGLLDEFCPHRLVSLWLGRNEESGLRCVYHGWKFDVNGACVDQMNEPAECSFAHKIRTTAYPTVELGGIIWAYMGPQAKMPPPPTTAFPPVTVTSSNVNVTAPPFCWRTPLLAHVCVMEWPCPFTVNAVAQAAAIASLAAEPELLARVDQVVKERVRVRDELLAQGWSVPPTEANFVWLRLNEDTEDFAASCALDGIGIRPFAGEGARVSIGDEEDNEAFLAAARAYPRHR